MKNTDKTEQEQNASTIVDASLHPIQKYVMGDMKFLDEWLDERPVVVQFPNWFLRGIGAPIFLNNPISGKKTFRFSKCSGHIGNVCMNFR